MPHSIEKIYLGDSYQLAGVRVYTGDGDSFEIKNASPTGKRMSNRAFLIYVKQLVRGLL